MNKSDTEEQRNPTSTAEFYEHRGRVAGAIADHERWQWEMQSEWTVETVKHLATVNIAGIAGVAALLTSENTSSNMLRWALISFTVGLLLALLDFWLNSMGYWKRATNIHKHVINASIASNDFELSSAATITSDAGKDWFDVAVRVGWTSALSAIIGGLLLGSALFTN